VPSSHHSGSIAANRTIAASCTAAATSSTCCSDPTADAHSWRDPATDEGASTARNAAAAASAEACTSPGPIPTLLTPAPCCAALTATPNIPATTDRPPLPKSQPECLTATLIYAVSEQAISAGCPASPAADKEAWRLSEATSPAVCRLSPAAACTCAGVRPEGPDLGHGTDRLHGHLAGTPEAARQRWPREAAQWMPPPGDGVLQAVMIDATGVRAVISGEPPEERDPRHPP
jgi:hypothetical protein